MNKQSKLTCHQTFLWRSAGFLSSKIILLLVTVFVRNTQTFQDLLASCLSEMMSLVPHKAHPHAAAVFSGFCSPAVFPPFPALNYTVLHSLVQTVLSNLRNSFRHPLSSLCQDGKNLKSFTLHERLSETFLCLHHVVNYDHSTMTQVSYFTEQQRLYNL